MSTLWILGAPDAEMTAIESLLRDCGQSFTYALAPDRQGALTRVAPGQVATNVACTQEADAVLVAIEVAGPWGLATIDHHDDAERASWGPDRFLQASSLGQVVERLAQMGALPTSWGGDFLESIDARDEADGTFIDSPGGIAVVSAGCFRIVPQALVFEAAADHCPAAAVAGLCPGVDPGAFAPFLAESKRRQYFPAMSPEDFARELATSRATLLAAPEVDGLPYVRDLRHLEPGTVPAQGSGECYPAEFLVGIVAGIFEGLGFICRIRRRDGKLALRSNGHGQGTLAGTRPAEVFLADPAAFGCGPRFPAGQDASYGNPIRGFFGGLLRGDL